MTKSASDGDLSSKMELTEQQYEVTQCGGTEAAFSGEFWDHKEGGQQHCVCCEAKLFDSESKGLNSLIGLDKNAALAIQNHFRLSNYQMLVLSWIKGIWTGILLSLIFHSFISH